MGVGVITIDGVDRTAYIERSSVNIERGASRLNPLCQFTLRDESLVDGSSIIPLVERMDVLATDDAAELFVGEIATINPRPDGLAIEYDITCVGETSKLRQRVVEDWTGAPALPCTDAELATWIVSWGSDLDLAGDSYVSQTRTTDLTVYPELTGKDMYNALSELTQYTPGAIFYIALGNEGGGHVTHRELVWTTKESAQLIANGGFDDDLGSWTVNDASSSLWTDDSGPAGTGDGCLVTIGDGTGNEIVSQTITSIVAARRYMLNGDQWCDSIGADTGRMYIDWKTAADAHISYSTSLSVSATSTWETLKEVVTAPALAEKATIILELASATSTAEARFDNISLIAETAPFGMSTSPDGSATEGMQWWQRPTEATNPVNRVLVKGAGIEGWREHPGSQAYYGKTFEAVLEDDRVTTTDGIDSRAAWAFAKYAYPNYSGQFHTEHTGLDVGQWVILELEPLGLLSIEWIATIQTTFKGNGYVVHRVTYGTPEEDTAAQLAQMQSAFTGSEPSPGGGSGLPDLTAPATPTAVNLATGNSIQEDGALKPYLNAYFTGVADTDVQAYELELDRAITGAVTFVATASSTGGTLPAGDYAVQVTAEGIEAGETAITQAPQIVTLAAGERLYVNITAKSSVTTYKVYASILAGTEDNPQDTGQTTTTTGSAVEVTAAGSGAVYPPTSSTAVSFLDPLVARGSGTSYYFEDVEANLYYGLRVRAEDSSANQSGWTAIIGTTAGVDNEAPLYVQGLEAIAAFKGMGLRWPANTEPDFDHYELRWEITETPGVIGAGEDTSEASSRTNFIFITDLYAGEADGSVAANLYGFQVRAVDRSGNVIGYTHVPTLYNNLGFAHHWRMTDLTTLEDIIATGSAWDATDTGTNVEANSLLEHDQDGAVTFGGTSGDYWNLGDQTDFDGVAAFEFSAWVSFADFGTEGYIFKKGNTGVTIGTALYVTTGGVLTFERAATGSDTATGGTLVAGQVHHVGVSYDGAEMTVYLDGVAGTPVASTRSLANSADPLILGQLNDMTIDEPAFRLNADILGPESWVALAAANSSAAFPGAINSNLGWSEAVSGTPTLIGGSSVAYGSIVSDHIAVAGLDAGTITTGNLQIGGQPNMPDYLTILDATGQTIGQWSEDGLLITDPNDPNLVVRVLNGEISFSEDAGVTYSTAISGKGIRADSILLGTSPGGHNSIPNSSLELSDFASEITEVWTAAADWQTHITSTDINIDDSTTELRMTSYSY